MYILSFLIRIIKAFKLYLPGEMFTLKKFQALPNYNYLIQLSTYPHVFISYLF